MVINPIDQRLDLFFIEDVYPSDMLDELLSVNLLSIEHVEHVVQVKGTRRDLRTDSHPVLQKISRYPQTLAETFSNIVGRPIDKIRSGIWLNLPEFYMDSHLDGYDHVKAGMQVYLNDNDEDLGTVFFNGDGTVRFQVPYRKNCGYFMINGLDQYHGMPKPVPSGTTRLSSYTWIDFDRRGTRW